MLSRPPERPLIAIPARFRDRVLDSYEPATPSQRAALRAAQQLARGTIRNLVLVGPPGVGKTHLAAGIANAIARAEQERYDALLAKDPVLAPAVPILPRWLNVASAIVEMRMEFGGPADDRQTTTDVLHAHLYRGLVVLDDLGREKVSDWTGEVIYALVNARYEGLHPTVVTSNLTAAELAEGPYWPAISRLAEDGELVKVDGPDRRLAK